MTYAIGRGVRVEIGTTEGAPKTVTAVTAAKPPVATSTAHGLALKSLGYFSVATGMPALEGQACRLSAQTTNDFTLEDLDATSYGTFTAGSFVPVTAWTTLVEATSYNKAGGDPNPQDVSVLLDQIQQNVNGLLSAETVNFSARTPTISSVGLQRIREVAKTQGYLMFRITLSDGNVRFFRGQPSLPSEGVDQGTPGQTAFSVTLKNYWCEGAA
jgi:hypothetical protein